MWRRGTPKPIAVAEGIVQADVQNTEQRSIHREVITAAMTVATLTVAVKGFAIVREIFVAGRYGVSDGLDAYLAAFAPLALAAGMVGALNAAFVPSFVTVLQRNGERAAHDLLQSVSWKCLLALTGLTLILLV